MGIPGTIDNDISCSDYTIGFDTALNTACQMIDDLRDTAESHARCIIAEVMGNGCGYLTLYTGIATGAIFMAIPEIPFDKEYAITKVREARELHGKRGIIAVCCEGMPKVSEMDYGKALAAEIRDFLVKRVTENGGHLASNLGVVELTLALHKVFSAPDDDNLVFSFQVI